MKPFQKRKLVLFFLFPFIAFSQEETRWQDRLFYGGNFALNIGNITFIEVSPLAGYRIIPRVSAGIGGKYIYYRNPYWSNEGTHIYGSSLFATVVVIKKAGDFLHSESAINVFLHAEEEFLSLEKRFFKSSSSLNEITGRFVATNFWIGPGIKQRIGSRGGIYLMALWNLSSSGYSLYANPSIRAGFIF